MLLSPQVLSLPLITTFQTKIKPLDGATLFLVGSVGRDISQGGDITLKQSWIEIMGETAKCHLLCIWAGYHVFF